MYKIGNTIYPEDNSFQTLIKQCDDFDGIDHSGTLYHKPCIVYSEEFTMTPFLNKKKCTDAYKFVEVLYNGGIYRVMILPDIDMSIKP